jgi:hypothetical protein
VTISLDLADRLCLAAGTHIAHNCRLVWPSGKVTAYPDLDVTLPDNLA